MFHKAIKKQKAFCFSNVFGYNTNPPFFSTRYRVHLQNYTEPSTNENRRAHNNADGLMSVHQVRKWHTSLANYNTNHPTQATQLLLHCESQQ